MADLGVFLGYQEQYNSSIVVALPSYGEATQYGAPIYVEPGEFNIEGYTLANGSPVSKKVAVHDRATNVLLGSTVSSPVTGFFSFTTPSRNPVYVICFPDDGEPRNAEIYDMVLPLEST